jgi:hypothetical protein
MKDVQAKPQEKLSALKKRNPAFQNMRYNENN